jgi:uncharacterized damage-inducible protein DinB
MNSENNRNAVTALLSEYEKTIIALQNVIENISDEDLAFVVDSKTENPDCKSIQTVLAHVVSSGYSYNIYIQKLKNKIIERPVKTNRMTVSEYKNDLNNVIQFTHETFSNITDNELEEFDNTKKINTSWGQIYDIEQLMEHAIVHVLRHRRQIEKFKIALKSKV